jgi:CHAD domain-containing protein
MNKKTYKRKGTKKNKAKIWQEKTKWWWNLKKLSQTKRVAIKRIRYKLETLTKLLGVKLKIICNMIDYL